MKIKQYILPLIIGIVGAALYFTLYHLYQDHQTLHGLINLEIQRQNAAQSKPSPKDGDAK